MIRTFNRTPAGVKDINPDYKFFNHTNWKGANTNKNFLSIDQETFEDCKNVYVDANGILKSRPSIKVDTEKQTSLDKYKVYKLWSFADTIVHLVKEGSNPYKLLFQKDGQSYIPNMSFDSENNFKLVLADNKIFVFTETNLYYFDNSNDNTVTNRWFEANDYIYIPTTEYYVNGVLTNSVEENVKNELTKSYITSYIFDSIDDISTSLTALNNQSVILKYDGNTYNITFTQNTELTFLEKTIALTSDNFSSKYTYGVDGEGIPLMSVSDVDTAIICSITDEQTDNGIVQNVTIFYMVNNVIHSVLPHLDNIIGVPKISKDGLYVFAFTKNALNIINVADDGEGTRTYPIWTNILKELNWTYADCIDFSYCDSHILNTTEFISNVFCNGDFITDDVFAFVTTIKVNEPNYVKYVGKVSDIAGRSANAMLVVCEEGSFKETLLGDYSIAKNITTTGTVYQGNDGGKYCSFNPIEVPIEVSFNGYDNTVTLGTMKVDSIWTEYIPPTTYDADDYYTLLKCNVNIVTNDGRSYQYSIGYSGLKLTERPSPSYKDNSMYCSAKLDKYTYKVGDTLTLTFDEIMTASTSIYGKQMPSISMYHDNETSTVILVGTDINLEFMKIYTKSSEIAYEDDWPDNLTSTNVQKYSVLALKNSFKYVKGRTIYTYTFYDNTFNETSVSMPVFGKVNRFSRITTDGTVDYVITEYYVYDGQKSIPLLFPVTPISINMKMKNKIYACTQDNLYTTHSGNVEMQLRHMLENTLFVPDAVSELDELYFSKGNTLYISQYPASETFKWYFPKISTTTFETDISALHPISATEMGIFLKNAIYYNSKTELGYVYNKSKTGVGCEKGSTVITSFDGKSMIFSSDRGLVAMSYQDFVASTEQTLTFLSDAVYAKYKQFNTGPVKLYQYDYWIICYKENSQEAFVLDIRNVSMWPVEYSNGVTDIITVHNKPLLISNNTIKYFDTSDNDYADDSSKIDWYFVSQKLHLNALNYYKRVLNLIIASVNDNSNSCDTKLEVRNYRKKVDEGKMEVIEYDVDMIRTFVKRVNYAKVSEFQYKLSSNLENAIQVPLGIANIAIKYLITGVTR